jgi:glycosyltransferase involved in cell wall biosynthesis
VRILILNWKDLSHPAAGGAEVFTEEVARSLVERGHSATLLAAAVEGRPSHELVEGVDIVRRGSRFGVYRAARQFWSQQPAGSYDVVVDEVNTRPFMTPRWLRGTPIVALIHQLAREVWSYEMPFPVSVVGRYVLEPWWLRAYRDVPAITVSPSSAESLERYHGWRDVTVVPEGYTPHPVPDVSKEPEPTVVFLGRLVGMKRPGDAIEAFALGRRRRPAAPAAARGGPAGRHVPGAREHRGGAGDAGPRPRPRRDVDPGGVGPERERGRRVRDPEHRLQRSGPRRLARGIRGPPSRPDPHCPRRGPHGVLRRITRAAAADLHGALA